MSSKEANDIHTLWPYILWHFYNVAFFFHPNYFEVALTPFYLLLRKRKPSVRLPDPHGYDDMNYIWTRQSQWVGTCSKCHKTIFCSQFLLAASDSHKAVDIIITKGPPSAVKGNILCSCAILMMSKNKKLNKTNIYMSTTSIQHLYVYIAITLYILFRYICQFYG